MKKYSKKGLEKRREERAGYAEFFTKHMQIAKTRYCEECGAALRGDVSEIAHVLPKQYFKSVATNDLNVLYLCGMGCSGNHCHSKFDNSPQETVKQMKIYPKVQEIFKQLESEITEKINYKHRDLYE